MQRHVVCKKEELRPGAARSVEVGGRRVAVACVEEGYYRAVADTCPHEMASLSKGKAEKMWTSDEARRHRPGEKDVIVCPWHNFEFDLETGLCVTEPERLRVKTYEAKVEDSHIVVYV